MGEKTHKMIYSDIQDKVRIITNDKYKLNSFCLDNVKIVQLANGLK